eukprot:TRINITY_DN5021_c0_g1_i1.p1 TRINITY_DN5021_c0_g1~~TRINITY_DN5021_c0_g1_i1.p1  ORF type:complete len:329 (-),score=69.09 TRINITY_DN5021_c0_g1_i1:11-997(-)
MNPANKEAVDVFYEPNHTAVLPRKPAFVYHLPVELEGPAHPPDNLVFQEHWKFYDVDINVVKEATAWQIALAKNLTREEYLIREEDYNEFKAYLGRQRKHPQVGQYRPRYKLLDKRAPVPDFEKYPERKAESDYGDEPREGDVLLLSPDKLKPHLQTIDLGKLGGRPRDEPLFVDEDQEQLVLAPLYELVRRRVPNLVNMAKQPERKELFNEPEEGEEVVLDIKRDVVEQRSPNWDFAKVKGREDDEVEVKEEVVLNPKIEAVKPKVKGAVNIQNAPARFKSDALDDEDIRQEKKELVKVEDKKQKLKRANSRNRVVTKDKSGRPLWK